MSTPVIYIKDSSGNETATYNQVIQSGKIDVSVNDENEEVVDLDNLDINSMPGMGMSNAIIEGVSRYMEVLIQTFISSGATNILSAMGINPTTIGIAKQLVNIADTGMTLVSSIMTAVPSNIYMIPSGSSCMDVLCTSFRDIFDSMYISLKEQLLTEWNNAITNLPTLEEMYKELLQVAIDQAMALLDMYCFKYTGYHIYELYYMVHHYIALYKQYKEMKKQMNSNGYNVDANVSVKMDPSIIKQQLLQELEECSDLLYNSFIIIQIKDTITQIQEMIQQFHDADLTTLTEGIESFTDVMELLEELGLDDDSSYVLSLADTITSSINQFQSNAMQLLGRMGAQALSSGMNLASATANSININTALNISQMYEFKADTENHAIIMYIYADPTTKNFKNALNTTLSEKDENGIQYISNADILNFLNKITECYNDNSVTPELQIKTTTYKFVFDIKPQIDTNINLSNSIPNNTTNTNITSSYALGVVTEEFTTDPLEKRKRPTIQLVHELFVILKQFLPILQIIVVLISNYKINKEKVKNHATGNLYGLAKLIANAKKLTNKVNINTTNFYTVRTLKFYNYIKNDIHDPGSNAQIIIDKSQTELVYVWLKSNNCDYNSINVSYPTLLYIDWEQINLQKKQMQDEIDNLNKYFDDSSLYVEYPDAKYKDGDLLGLDKVESIGNEIYYSDSSLPVYGSQIWIAYSKL